ncbi:MAG: DUF1592 domain-containing protein [Pirellulaceae bacterium]|nr:DUF1592 domain-containing protein [Pirellulaceae bacterium]
MRLIGRCFSKGCHAIGLIGVSSVVQTVTACVLIAWSSCGKADEAANEASYQQTLLPMLRTYCLDCHDSQSEISLADDTSALALQKNRKLWVRALAQVRIGAMPPADGDKMDPQTRKQMGDLIDSLANAVDCVRNPNAGKVALRRLNRHEYRNTIRDLTGVDYSIADGFPGDDVGYGFDNIGDVLSLPPILLEKYLDAAETISGEAIYTPPPPDVFEIDRVPSSLIGSEKFSGSGRMTMASHGTVTLQVDVPFAGLFQLTVTASGDQGGDQPAKMEIRSGSTKKIVDVPSEKEKDYEVTLRLARGTRKIDISFINDFYVAGKIDRNLHLHHVNLRGEERKLVFVSDDDLPASHRHLIFVKPSKSVTVEVATAQVLGRLASRAFRRPATNQEVRRLTELAATVRRDGGSYEESIQVALQAILVSPHFLFKVEQPREPDANGQMPPISDYELAVRISYFLWSSMPDDELLLMAHRGELRDRAKLLQKVGRMINDRRSNRFVESFASQWLQLRNLDNVDPDTRIYRTFNDEIRQLMRRETLTFFAGVMRENRPVTTLLDAEFTYLNEPLAKFYGLSDVRGDEFRRVSLAGTQRGGLLTHASVLTVTSNPTRTSPVKRGKWVMDNLLNTPPPPAPADVPELEKSRLVGTLRERMEQHRENPACAACHTVMDPLGFALENFDAVGLWRTRDGADDINASGELPDGTKFNGVQDLRQMLSTSRREQFVRCLAEKMLIYALGRGTEYYDKCAVDKIVADITPHDYRFAYLIAAIIQSDPFQKQGHRE